MIKTTTEKITPSLQTSLPMDLGGNTVQLLPAENSQKATEGNVTTGASVEITFQTTTSLVVLHPKDYGVWFRWGTSNCAGTTDNFHGFAHADQPMMLVKPPDETAINFIARGGTSVLSVVEY